MGVYYNVLEKLKKRRMEEIPSFDPSCPFCPGNEQRTPPEAFRLPLSNTSPWEVRIIPNMFPALRLDEDTPTIEEGHFFSRRAGIGTHEVIIETPSHNTPMALMEYEQVEKVLTAYQQRYNTLKKNPQLKFITIFKNHGRESGTSLAHPHSQLVATPIMTPYYHRRFDVAVDYYSDTGKCLYCDILIGELEKRERIVAETKQFIVFHPYASRASYETWIISKGHCSSFACYSLR